MADLSEDSNVAQDEESTVRLNFSVSDQTILTSLYISGVVLLAFMTTGLLLHRNAKDKRLHLFRSSNLFAVHLAGCMFMSLCGLISVYVQHPLFHAFNAFALFLLVIFFNHLGCSKYSYLRTVRCCCASPRKSLLFRLIYFTENKYNLALSGSLVFVNIIWWIYYSSNIEDLSANEGSSDTNHWTDSFIYFLIIMYAIVVLHTGVASIYSKISLGVFIVLFPLFIICFSSALYYTPSEQDLAYESLLVYWFVFLFALVSSISFFACSKELKLQLISISLIGGFLSIFDLLTDLVLIITWFREEKYFFVILQVIFIGSGTIYSSVFITRFYFDKDSRDQYIGQTLTLLGLGRLWHGILAWDMDNHSYVMLLGNKMIKIWEMFLESYPSIFLQLWIVLSERDLKAESSNPVIWSLFVSVSSITFTVFRILYFDHRARHKNSGIFQDAVEQIDNEIIRQQIALAEQMGPQQQPKIQEMEPQQQKMIRSLFKDVELEVRAETAAVKDTNYPQSSMSHEPEPEAIHSNNNNKVNHSVEASLPNLPKLPAAKAPAPINSKLQAKIAREQHIRDEMRAQQERVLDAQSRKKQEREEALAQSSVTIIFQSKPLGCTLYRGDNELNAWIADVKDGNQYIDEGLRIGLYVHTLNYEIVDNDAYYGILTRVRDLQAPVVVGFNPYPPLNPEDESIMNLQNMGFDFIDLQCAWQQINASSDTMTTKDVDFESKMLQILTEFNQVDEEVMISQYQHDLQHYASFDHIYSANEEDIEADDISTDDDHSASELFGGYYYTQRELEHSHTIDDEDRAEYKPLNINRELLERKNSYERFLEENDAIGPISAAKKEPAARAFARFDSDPQNKKGGGIKEKLLSKFKNQNNHNLPESERQISAASSVVRFDSEEKAEEFVKMNPVLEEVEEEKKVNNNRDRTRGENIAELIGAVERVQDEELITITFKRKPFGFDREAGRFGLNCRVCDIHIKKLRKQNLKEGYYVRAINNRYVERLKFHAIESLLRNAPCPLKIIFRMSEPPLPQAMLKKLEVREWKKKQRKKLLLVGDEADDDKEEEEEDEEDAEYNELAADKVAEELTIRHEKGAQLAFKIGYVNEEDDVRLNAKIVSIHEVSLLDAGVRLGMFVHAIDGMICDFKEFELIKVTLDTVIYDKDCDITFSLYKPLDLEHPKVRSLCIHNGFSEGEVKAAWRILNRQKIDEMNDIEMNNEVFELEMLKILFKQREIEDKFYEKINENRLFGLDFDPGKPITIFFEKRPLGFECESGDELINGKNAKISSLTNEHYHSIGLKDGMLVHKINGHIMDNLHFTQITSILRTHKLPMTITFTKSIALSNLKYVIKCTFGVKPFGFVIRASNPMTRECPAIVDRVTNKKLMIQKISEGMTIHNVNGIDVMNNMQVDDLERMLDRLQLPIVVGFIDMQRVEKESFAKLQKEAQKAKLKEKLRKEKKKKKLQKEAGAEKEEQELAIVHRQNPKLQRGVYGNIKLEILAQSQFEKKKHEQHAKGLDCCTKKCVNDVFGTKSLNYLIFYLFTITELYCRIYPMLVVIAYVKKREEDNISSIDDLAVVNYNYVYLVGLAVFVVILTFETIAYKQILVDEYASWKTVFKQLYFATFTISFFLLSTMGLAYLEKNVNFEKLMKYEFTGRQIIGFFFVAFVTMHQAITLDYDEWKFGPTLFAYYVLLWLCVATHFYLRHTHMQF